MKINNLTQYTNYTKSPIHFKDMWYNFVKFPMTISAKLVKNKLNK